MADLRGFKNERFKGRRHSYSARGFAAKLSKRPPLTPSNSHTSSSTHSTPVNGKKDFMPIKTTADSLTSLAKDGRGRKRMSLRNLFRSKLGKTQSHPTTAVLGCDDPGYKGSTSSIASSDRMVMADPFRGQNGEFVRVITTVLHPQLHYKTLRITQYSTVYEVIVELVGKYGRSLEDQNPDIFYMTEVRESDQGSYLRVLENSDRVYEIQSRWEDGKECFFTLCRKEFTAVGDDPFNAMILPPSQDSFYSSFTGLIDVDIPNTPTSPHGMAQKFSFFDPPVSPVNMFLSNSPTPTSFVLPMSPSNISGTTEVDVMVNESTNNCSSLSDKESPWKHKPSEVNRLMQLSVSEGMLGIMTKVMEETKQRKVPQAKSNSNSRQRRATVSLTADEMPLSSSPTQRKSSERVTLRPLIFSLVESAQKRYPELVITPKGPVVGVLSTSIKCMGEGSCEDVGGVKKIQLSLDELSDLPGGKIDSITSPTISNKTIENKTTPKNINKSSSSCSSVNYFKTSHYIPVVKFATTLTAYPKYRSNASIYPSFSKTTHYSTEMDMSTTVTNMLDTRFRNHRFSAGRERWFNSNLKNGADTSSSTKEKGTNRNTSKLILKRPHTFHVKREHLMFYSLNQDEDKPHLRDLIVERAALAIQQRNNQRNSLKLSKNDTFPRHVHQGSSTSRKGSSSSIASEVESDLDTLLNLRSRRLSSCSGSSEQSLTANEQQRMHLRIHSDGIIPSDCRSVSPYHDGSLSNSNRADRSNVYDPTIRRLSVPSHSKPYQYISHPDYLSNTHSTGNLHQQAASLHSIVPNSPLYKTSCDGFQTSSSFSFGTDTWWHKSVDEINVPKCTAAEVKDNKSRNQSDSDPEEEVLYTFQSNQRPITVLVRCKSSVALNQHLNSGVVGQDKVDNNLRITKSSVNLAASSSDSSSGNQRMTVTERDLSPLRKNKEIWDFSQRRSRGKVKSWFSDL